MAALPRNPPAGEGKSPPANCNIIGRRSQRRERTNCYRDIVRAIAGMRTKRKLMNPCRCRFLVLLLCIGRCSRIANRRR
jgi:hypothetical protein